MDDNRQQEAPDESTIVDLFQRIKPKPSQRFYQHMISAPWNTEYSLIKRNIVSNRIRILKPGIGFLVLLILAFVFTYLFVPSVRVTADQIIHFFLPSSSNQLQIKVTPESPTVMLDFSNPENFQLSSSEVQKLVKFKVGELSSLPSELMFIGTRYEQSYNSVIFLYISDDYDLLFTQHPVRNSQDVFRIGESANIEIIDVGEHKGEYVLGGWKALPTTPLASYPPLGSPTEINAVWDNSLPQSTLRWQSGGMVYELRAFGMIIPSQSELIEWANGLK